MAKNNQGPGNTGSLGPWGSTGPKEPETMGPGNTGPVDPQAVVSGPPVYGTVFEWFKSVSVLKEKHLTREDVATYYIQKYHTLGANVKVHVEHESDTTYLVVIYQEA